MTDLCGSYAYSQNTYEEMFEHIIIKKSDLKSVEKASEKIIKYKMNFEKYRIESFINWPISYISPKALAKNGFYYLGIGDQIKCNFCDIKLHQWKAEDTVEGEHRKHSPYCQILTNKYGDTGNIPFIQPSPPGENFIGGSSSQTRPPLFGACLSSLGIPLIEPSNYSSR